MPQTDVFRLVGQQIDHRYRIDAIVGEGGFGVVYRGWHVAFQRPVAIKCLKTPSHFTDDARRVFVDKFREEASLVYRLNERCPHVVQVLDVGVLEPPGAPSVPYLVLEWLDGKSLREAIDGWRAAGQMPLTEAAAVALLAPVVQALASAHRGDAGVAVAHRDLKPENVFVLASGSLKLLDFGIAKVMQEGEHVTMLQSQTSSGFSSFSPLYGAPEQFNPRAFGQTGPWTDVHGLGLLLVELVSGCRALDGDDYPTCFAASQRPQRPTPRRLGSSVSDGFEAVCERALALDPRQRFADAAALLSALSPWMQAVAAPTLPSSAVAATVLPRRYSATAPTDPGDPQPPAPAAAPTAAPVGTSFPLGTFVPHPALSLPPDRSRSSPDLTPGFETKLGPAVATLDPGPAPAPLVAQAFTSPPTPPPAASLPALPPAASWAPAQAPTATPPATARKRRRWPLALGLGAAVAAVGAAVAVVGFARDSDRPAPRSSPSSPSASALPAGPTVGEGVWARPAVASPSAKAGPGARLARLIRIEGATFSAVNLLKRVFEPERRMVTVATFLMDETEVTVDAFRQCVEAGGCSDFRLTRFPGCNWGKPDHQNYPMNCLTALQADEFCRWADRRLPTSDEWELAAHGPEGRKYPWGKTPAGAQLCWNGSGNAEGKGYRKEGCPVGSSPADVTPTGLKDMGGSVSEITASPDCGNTDEDRAACTRMSCSFRSERVCLNYRLSRGGSWQTNVDSLFDATRHSSIGVTNSNSETAGFRCARSP